MRQINAVTIFFTPFKETAHEAHLPQPFSVQLSLQVARMHLSTPTTSLNFGQKLSKGSLHPSRRGQISLITKLEEAVDLSRRNQWA